MISATDDRLFALFAADLDFFDLAGLKGEFAPVFAGKDEYAVDDQSDTQAQ